MRLKLALKIALWWYLKSYSDCYLTLYNCFNWKKEGHLYEMIFFRAQSRDPLISFSFPNKTSRERPKSAPYLRLKNSKRTSKCQVLSSTVPKKISKKFLNFFEVSVKSHCTEKCTRGPLAVFQHPFFCKIGTK